MNLKSIFSKTGILAATVYSLINIVILMVVLVGRFSSDPITRELWNSFSLTTDVIALVCISFNFVLWAIGYRKITSEDIARGVDKSEKVGKIESDLIITKATVAESLKVVSEVREILKREPNPLNKSQKKEAI